jgi:hypothetical protein
MKIPSIHKFLKHWYRENVQSLTSKLSANRTDGKWYVCRSGVWIPVGCRLVFKIMIDLGNSKAGSGLSPLQTRNTKLRVLGDNFHPVRSGCFNIVMFDHFMSDRRYPPAKVMCNCSDCTDFFLKESSRAINSESGGGCGL